MRLLPTPARDDGWVWVDVPEPDESTAQLLTERFGIHPKAASGARVVVIGALRFWRGRRRGP